MKGKMSGKETEKFLSKLREVAKEFDVPIILPTQTPPAGPGWRPPSTGPVVIFYDYLDILR